MRTEWAPVAPTAAAAHIPAPPPVNGTSAMVPEIQSQVERKSSDGDILEVALDLIDNNPYQTRGIFREDELRELADSIKVSGVIQPVVLRASRPRGETPHPPLRSGARRRLQRRRSLSQPILHAQPRDLAKVTQIRG